MADEVVKRDRGGLEQLVLEVCKEIEAGAIPSEPGKPWTPHRLAKLVADKFAGTGASPSSGAITDNLKRWLEIGFINGTRKPLAFESFTEEARTVGLAGLKEQYRANRPPRERKPRSVQPTGAVTLEVNPGQSPEADDTATAEAAAALQEVQAAVPTPAEALAEANEVEDGHTQVIYNHDDAEYAQGDPHPTAQDDVQTGWQPRDEWDDADQSNTQGTPAEGGEFRDQRSIELDADEFTDQPRADDSEDPFQN